MGNEGKGFYIEALPSKWWHDGSAYLYGQTYVAIVKQTNHAARIDPGIAKAIEVVARERSFSAHQPVPMKLS